MYCHEMASQLRITETSKSMTSMDIGGVPREERLKIMMTLNLFTGRRASTLIGK
jgi:hypothetical protein